MVDLAPKQPLDGGLRGAPPAGPLESDFSPRKIKIATASLLGMTFATSLLPLGALSFVLIPMTTEFGWSRAEFTLASSFLLVFGALTIWILGRMTDRIGVRPIIIGGTVAAGAVTLCLPYVSQLWQFYGLFALLGVVGASAASYSKVIASLFTRNRGKAIAILGLEGTAARSIIPMVTSFLILTYSWRGMFTALGLVILAVAPVLYFALEEPGTIGLAPKLGFRRKPAAQAPPQPRVALEGMSTGEVLRDKAFWMLLGGGLLGLMVAGGITTNTVAAIIDKGFTQGVAARLISLGTFTGLGGTILGGYLMDRFHSAKIAIPFSIITALGYAVFMIASPKLGGQPLLFASVGLGMFAVAAQLPMGGYFLTRFFGLKSFAEVTGLQACMQGLCVAIGAPLVGLIHDKTGSYDIAFEVGIAAGVISATVYWLLPGYRFSANIGGMVVAPRGVATVGDPVTITAQ